MMMGITFLHNSYPNKHLEFCTYGLLCVTLQWRNPERLLKHSYERYMSTLLLDHGTVILLLNNRSRISPHSKDVNSTVLGPPLNSHNPNLHSI